MLDRPPSDALAAASPRVLVADDSPAAALLVTRVLESEGCRVDVVGDGLAAVDAALGGSYDLIVLDFDMPGLDGLATAEAIRSAERRAGRTGASLVILSAGDGGDLPARCQAVGIDGCLPKSAASVRALYGYVAARREQATIAAQLPAGDSDLTDLLTVYLQEVRDHAARLPGLLEAGRFDEIARIAHQLHGSGGAYGLVELSLLGAQLERAAHERDGGQAARLSSRLRVLTAVRSRC